MEMIRHNDILVHKKTRKAIRQGVNDILYDLTDLCEMESFRGRFMKRPYGDRREDTATVVGAYRYEICPELE